MDLTFIEVMPMGDIGNEDRLDQYWSLSELRDRLAQEHTPSPTCRTVPGAPHAMSV